MPDIYLKQLAEIGTRLQLINEERNRLLDERKAIISKHEAVLAKNFNFRATPAFKP